MIQRPVIGLSIFLRGQESVWSNGACMNVVFLSRCLRAGGYQVVLLNGGDGEKPDAGLMLDGLDLDIRPIADAIDSIDLLIEGSAQVSTEHVERVHRRGGKAVTYKFGNAYVIDNERMIHGKESGAIFNGAKFDAVWTNAQHVRTCRSLWETGYRAPVRVLPHIWEPLFVDKTIREFPAGLTFGYKPGSHRKRVGVFEPNINLVKTCVTPLLVLENVHRARPDALGQCCVTNALKLKEHLTFAQFAGHLDIARDRIVSFEGRYNTPWFMASHCDVMLAHQWENALNYAYYDALYGAYPLVHNSEMLPDGIGYRYDGFDAVDGARALLDAIDHHDAVHEEYAFKAREFLAMVNALAPRNVAAHAQAIGQILN